MNLCANLSDITIDNDDLNVLNLDQSDVAMQAYEKSQGVLLKFYKKEYIGFVHMYILQNFNFKKGYLENPTMLKFFGLYFRRIIIGILICSIREFTNPKYIKQAFI